MTPILQPDDIIIRPAINGFILLTESEEDPGHYLTEVVEQDDDQLRCDAVARMLTAVAECLGELRTKRDRGVVITVQPGWSELEGE